MYVPRNETNRPSWVLSGTKFLWFMRKYEIEFFDETGRLFNIHIDSSNDYADGHPLNIPMLVDLVDAFITPRIRNDLGIKGNTLFQVKLYSYPDRIGGVLVETNKVTINP